MCCRFVVGVCDEVGGANDILPMVENWFADGEFFLVSGVPLCFSGVEFVGPAGDELPGYIPRASLKK